jgi:nucleotide-binding universal stress UspA family protein
MAAETGADAGQGFPAAVRADRQRSTWDEAVDDVAWSDGDVLVVGSSSLEPVSRVFLGSRATKILATHRCPSSFRVVPSRVRQRPNPQEYR